MSRVEELAAQCLQWKPRFAVIPDAELARRLREQLRDGPLTTKEIGGAKAGSEWWEWSESSARWSSATAATPACAHCATT